MLQDKTCELLCLSKVPGSDASFINARINENYMMHWYVDGLPAGRNASSHYTMGFALGSRDQRSSILPAEQGPLLYNHYDLTIQYHQNDKNDKFRVVGVLVVPSR